MDIIGTKWFKCDLHLHTTESACFSDKNVTAEQWVQAAINKKLNCIAVTDHNSGNNIDNIKEAAKDQNLFVFPGVELTCSEKKTHILVLFDLDKGSTEVNDFLVSVNIKREDFAKEGIQSDYSVADVITKAREHNAIVIPAHIDDFAGLSELGNASRKSILQNPDLNAVQIVNEEIKPEPKEYEKSVALKQLKDKYGDRITDAIVSQWRQTVEQAQQENLSFLTFSDNPHAEGSSKHGILGIGTRYTWIKMDINPSLESLRQALLLPKFRIKNDLDIKEDKVPYELPETWIESIRIENTQISNPSKPIKLTFSPQMNTLIGGRGSGKSSLLKFIRGVFTHKITELHDNISLQPIKDDFENFFKIVKKEQGVLNNGSKIEIILHRNNEKYKLSRGVLSNALNDTIVSKFNRTTNLFDVFESEGFINLIDIDIFSQKQIYEIGTKTNSLRNRIDKLVPDVAEKSKQIEGTVSEYKTIAKELREIEKKTAEIPIIETKIKDLEAQIETFNKSGVKELASDTKQFASERKTLETFAENVSKIESEISTIFEKINIQLPPDDSIIEKYNDDVKKVLVDTVSKVDELKTQLESSKNSSVEIHAYLIDCIKKSQWKTDEDKVKADFEDKKKELAEKGVEDLSKIEVLIKQLETNKGDLTKLEIEKAKIPTKKKELADIKKRHFKEREEVTKLRSDFLNSTLKSDNVQAKVRAFRDLSMIDSSFRNIMNSQTGYDDDFNELKEIWEGGHARNAESVNEKIFNIFINLKDDKTVDGFGGRFLKKVQGLNDESIDNINLFYPEDDIEIKYKKNGDKAFRSLSNASAGQKSASILTLLLSHGVGPLILDQPEDDLDNHLIYDLVVEQLRLSKDKRQIIVVTHNANIPVNGDSEHIVVMNSESAEISIKNVGTIENKDIKKEICTIMEGGTEAFSMRSKRYIGIN